MFLRLLFLLTLVPFLEIYFLMRVSGSIGWSNTLLVIFATGLLGAWLLKKQGRSIIKQMQQSSQRNQLPSDALAKGFFTFVGGLLLLTPGILTDALGLSLIFPLTQKLWQRYFVGQWSEAIKNGSVHVHTGFSRPTGGADPFAGRRGGSPFETPEEPRRVDSTVIDIKAQKSETTTIRSDED